MTLAAFMNQLTTDADQIRFTDTMEVIDECYSFEATAFTNGDLQNEAGQNNGSCKIFAFGLLNDLTVAQTLACFGDYYRKDVLENPAGADHQNIRNFMKSEWDGIKFSGQALQLK